MSRTETVELTNMCLLREGDKVLVEDRQKKEWPGITFPGGHVEPGESFHQAMIREFFEETGLTIKDPKLCGIKQFFLNNTRYLVLLYEATKYSGKIKASDEGAVFWLPEKDLLQQDLAYTFDEMYKVFVDKNLSEVYHVANNIDLY